MKPHRSFVSVIAYRPTAGIGKDAVYNNRLSWLYFVTLVVMLGGAALVVIDTLKRHHAHLHVHTFTHTHDGLTHTHTIEHSHDHNHYLSDENHGHHHAITELEKEMKNEKEES